MAPGPAPVPDRKLVVASSGAPKNAAEASALRSSEDRVNRGETGRSRPETEVGIVISQRRAAYAQLRRVGNLEPHALAAQHDACSPEQEAEVVANQLGGAPGPT